MKLYKKPSGVQSRWSTFENPSGEKGEAAKANQGGKGHPCENLAPGEVKTLIDIDGQGIISHIWMTIDKRSPQVLRALKLEIYWDGAETPAVSCPLGDFYSQSLGRMAAFENECFSCPEARSFNCYAPMPFKKHVHAIVTNESDENILFFYEIDYTLQDVPEDSLYFHTVWRRENPTVLAQDFQILPRIKGSGRFLGCNISVIADEAYGTTWWGEGEVKVYLDGDTDWPTMAGTGTEDYIGTGWGQNFYAQRFQGCLISDPDLRQWGFYRLHIPDPIFFDQDCMVAIQQIGGAAKPVVQEMQKAGIPLKPVTVASGVDNGYVRLLDQDPVPELDDPALTDFWCNFYRCDDFSAAAWFYLDKPENGLPALAPVADRVKGLADIAGDERADT